MNEGSTIQRITELEHQYYDAFCTRETDGPILRCEDLQIRDMHSHNFSQIQEPITGEALEQLIQQEITRRIENGQDFLQLKFPWKMAAEELPEAWRDGYTTMEYFQLTKRAVDRMRELEEVEVIQLSDFLLDDARELDELCEEGESKDFTNRRFERRSRVYLSEEGPDQYLALLDWMAVGTCDYFARDGVCMLEDFAVDPVYRHQGIGTTLLKSLAHRAFREGNDLVFLTCDSRESARAMYEKLGLEKIWETTEVLIRGLK